MGRLHNNCRNINILFEQLMQTPGRNDKANLVDAFRDMVSAELREDLDFCFEVLAGKHKLGYTYIITSNMGTATYEYEDYTIKEFVTDVLKKLSSSDTDINLASIYTSCWSALLRD